jgi:hypothetical protein
MAAFHAAKMAQLNAMGHGLDKLPPGLLPPTLDIAKVNNNQNSMDFLNKINQQSNVTIEPANNNKMPSSNSLDIRREREPMDLGPENYARAAHGGSNDGNSSGDDRNYNSEDEGATAVAAN